MNKQDLVSKFDQTQAELNQMMQAYQELGAKINKLQGRLETLKEIHDLLPAEE